MAANILTLFGDLVLSAVDIRRLDCLMPTSNEVQETVESMLD